MPSVIFYNIDAGMYDFFRRVAHLIRSYSDPNVSNWVKLPGKVKGRFPSFSAAEAYLEHKSTTDSEDQITTVINRARGLNFHESDKENAKPGKHY